MSLASTSCFLHSVPKTLMAGSSPVITERRGHSRAHREVRARADRLCLRLSRYANPAKLAERAKTARRYRSKLRRMALVAVKSIRAAELPSISGYEDDKANGNKSSAATSPTGGHLSGIVYVVDDDASFRTAVRRELE